MVKRNDSFPVPDVVGSGQQSHEGRNTLLLTFEVADQRAKTHGRVRSTLDRRPHHEIPDGVHCHSETGHLHSVILGYPDNMMRKERSVEGAINGTEAKNIQQGIIPTPEQTTAEFVGFKEVLELHGVDVYMPTELDVHEQIYTRDIGFSVGEIFFISNMAKADRKDEIHGISHLIDHFERKIQVPEGINIEGGDIIVDKGVVYMGIGQRTGENAIPFMQAALEGTGLVLEPIYIKQPEEGEDSLHLDCTFMPVGEGHALIYPEAMKNIPDSMKSNYQWIVVTREEQENLGTNVLSLSPQKVVSRHVATRINEEMRKAGLEVIELQFDQAPMNGGSFRCCTLPLRRNKSFRVPHEQDHEHGGMRQEYPHATNGAAGGFAKTAKLDQVA